MNFRNKEEQQAGSSGTSAHRKLTHSGSVEAFTTHHAVNCRMLLFTCVKVDRSFLQAGWWIKLQIFACSVLEQKIHCERCDTERPCLQNIMCPAKESHIQSIRPHTQQCNPVVIVISEHDKCMTDSAPKSLISWEDFLSIIHANLCCQGEMEVLCETKPNWIASTWHRGVAGGVVWSLCLNGAWHWTSLHPWSISTDPFVLTIDWLDTAVFWKVGCNSLLEHVSSNDGSKLDAFWIKGCRHAINPGLFKGKTLSKKQKLNSSAKQCCTSANVCNKHFELVQFSKFATWFASFFLCFWGLILRFKCQWILKAEMNFFAFVHC